MIHHNVTTANFSTSTDLQIIEAAREVLAKSDTPMSSLRPFHRKLLKTKKPDVNVAGKFLWAHLCGWKQ